MLADEQATLRRVAELLVARGAALEEVFAAVATEALKLLGGTATALLRYDPDNTAVAVATCNSPAPLGLRGPAGSDTATGELLRTRRPFRVDSFRRRGSRNDRKYDVPCRFSGINSSISPTPGLPRPRPIPIAMSHPRLRRDLTRRSADLIADLRFHSSRATASLTKISSRPSRTCATTSATVVLTHRSRQSRTLLSRAFRQAIGEAEGRHIQALNGAIADAQHKMAKKGA